MVIRLMENQTSPPENFTNHVRSTLEDLTLIRQSLLTCPDQITDRRNTGSQLLDIELSSELKTLVDALRTLHWAYIQTLSAQSGRQPAEILEWYKMEIAVEMLRALRGREKLVDEGETSHT